MSSSNDSSVQILDGSGNSSSGEESSVGNIFENINNRGGFEWKRKKHRHKLSKLKKQRTFSWLQTGQRSRRSEGTEPGTSYDMSSPPLSPLSSSSSSLSAISWLQTDWLQTLQTDPRPAEPGTSYSRDDEAVDEAVASRQPTPPLPTWETSSREYSNLFFDVGRQPPRLLSSEETGPPPPPDTRCNICCDQHVNHAAVPCGHTYCEACITRMQTECFFCRAVIEKIIKIYFH